MKHWKSAGAAFTTVVVGSLLVTTPGGHAATDEGATPPERPQVSPEGLRGKLGLSATERLVLKDVVRDADGTVHKRFDRTYKGLPVMGGDLIVHRAPGGKFTVDWASDADLSEVRSAKPVVSAGSAASLAARTTDLRARATDADLVVYAIGDEATLAWRAVATGPNARELVFVDAHSGDRIAGWSDIHDAKGTGKTLYSGTKSVPTVKKSATRYLLQDRSRGNHRVFDARNADPNDPPSGVLMKDRDNVWGNHRPANRQSAATDVAYGHRVTWDFYKSTFNRNGIRNNGTTPRSFVHMGNNFENAYFDDQCYCMVYGDGGSTFKPLVSVDVVSHEMSHGTTAATAGLIYFGESGGLNEASSDIFGTMAEFYARNSRDPGDYYIGEKVFKVNPGFLRRMDRPAADGASYNCWSKTMGYDDVHYTSGPANHWFYLLAEGSGAKTIGGRAHNSPTCNGTSVSGIGRAQAGQIWYRALNVYMLSTTNYMGARDATIRAAQNLYGANSTQCKRVVAAWKAVNAPAGDWTCAGAPPAKGANVVANAGFEAGDNGAWTDVPGQPGQIITNSPGAWPRTGNWYAWLGGYGEEESDSLSQAITVPNSPNAKLRFWAFVYTEDSPFGVYDTLTVEVLGTGGRVVKTLSNEDANNTYTRQVVDMSDWAGQNVTLKFTSAEDFLAASIFLIDDVSVTPN